MNAESNHKVESSTTRLSSQLFYWSMVLFGFSTFSLIVGKNMVGNMPGNYGIRLLQFGIVLTIISEAILLVSLFVGCLAWAKSRRPSWQTLAAFLVFASSIYGFIALLPLDELWTLVGDHTKLTFRFQVRDFRLTDVEGHVVQGLLA
jgi:ABC-type multidrug transport system fused ATPase/permease subunit